MGAVVDDDGRWCTAADVTEGTPLAVSIAGSSAREAEGATADIRTAAKTPPKKVDYRAAMKKSPKGRSARGG